MPYTWSDYHEIHTDLFFEHYIYQSEKIKVFYALIFQTLFENTGKTDIAL